MNIREEILNNHSKENAERIAEWIGDNEKRIDELMQLFLNEEYRIVQRAAFVVSKVGDQNPQLLEPYYDVMVGHLQHAGQQDAVKRNVLRILQDADIPEDLHGELMNICFEFLADINEPIAIRVFSMTVLDNLSNHYPEIRQELHAILEEQLELGCSAGFRSRAKKILKKT